VLAKPLHTQIHPKYTGIDTKSMGKIGPNHSTNKQIFFRTNLVTSEDKTTNHTNPVRTQTCVILVRKHANEEKVAGLLLALKKEACQRRDGSWVIGFGTIWKKVC